jgi:hypothetical protein
MMNVLFVLRARTQEITADLMFPRCKFPVGLGAKRVTHPLMKCLNTTKIKWR